MINQDYEIKYRLSKFVPIKFRDAVLDQFTVVRDGFHPGLTLRLSYYHLKQKTTLNYQQIITDTELNHPLSGDLILFSTIQMMVRELKKAGLNR